MYRRNLSILVVLIWLLPRGVAEGVDYTRWYPYSEASRLAEQGRRTLMVYFWRDGCAYCEQMNTFVLSEPAVSRLLERCFVVASVDSQSSEGVSLARRLRALGTPRSFSWRMARVAGRKPDGFSAADPGRSFCRS